MNNQNGATLELTDYSVRGTRKRDRFDDKRVYIVIGYFVCSKAN